jgi:hypothetical protein
LVLSNLNVYAQTASQINICNTNEVVIVFLNGINNTEYDARDSLKKLEEFYDKTTPNGEKIRYELLYNETLGMFEDLMEVFEQRMGELKDESGELLRNRYELFFDVVNGNGHWYNKVLDSIAAFGDVAVAFLDDVRLKIQESLFSSINSSPTAVNYTEHKTRIDNWVVEGKKLLFVAHSQGNLFANTAYDYAKSKVGEGSVKVIHIAPASSKTNGVSVLADQDLVIKGLRSIVGNLPETTIAIDNYFNRPAGTNGRKDPMGHGFVEIYINPNLATSIEVSMAINSALNSLVAPPVQAVSGFFTVTLTWDGHGDVDLHVYEPSGVRIYYANRNGDSGYLDVDNIYANGPEHYYASCDVNKLKAGIYIVAVANYSRADGRTATVQIASYQDGVLGTKSVTLGEATLSRPAYSMFSVLVSEGSSTNQYSVSLR